LEQWSLVFWQPNPSSPTMGKGHDC